MCQVGGVEGAMLSVLSLRLLDEHDRLAESDVADAAIRSTAEAYASGEMAVSRYLNVETNYWCPNADTACYRVPTCARVCVPAHSLSAYVALVSL
ncbi:MAG: hypothetical protein ACI9G1_004262 [Pirellulaceae bacterium]